MADEKISVSAELTVPAAGDYLPIVDISEAADEDKNKRILFSTVTALTGEVTSTLNVTVLDKTAITNRSAVTVADGDYIPIADLSNSSALAKVAASDFVLRSSYIPGLVTYNGVSAYQSCTYTSSGNKTTSIARFRVGTFTTDYKWMIGVDGSTQSRGQLQIGPSDAATTIERGKLIVVVKNSAGTTICRLVSLNAIADSLLHTVFFSFDGDAGTATFIIDGVAADDTGASSRVAPTTGTLQTGATSRFAVGRSPGLDSTSGVLCQIGFTGHRDAYLTNWSDFMEADGRPKFIDEAAWTQWGAQPLFWNAHGCFFVNNLGSGGRVVASALLAIAQENYWYSRAPFAVPANMGAIAASIASGFGTSPSITSSYGCSSFLLTIGTSTSGVQSGVITLPAMSNGWTIVAQDVTTPNSYIVSQSAGTTTSVTLKNYSRTTGLAADFVASSAIRCMAMGY